MTPHELPAFYLSAPPALPLDAIVTAAGTQQFVGHAPGYQAPVTRLDEPSSLTLALVGVVTLAAYRGIQKRFTPSAATTASLPKRTAIKPRRRAA